MPLVSPPTDPAEQLRWLTDRAAISDLLIEFARALDDRDWEAYADTYAEDGVLSISPTIFHSGRAGMADFVGKSLGRYAGTHHVSSNHAIAIAIDGDTATTRSYLIAAHVLDASDPYRHADGAGWYRCEVRRTEAGWRFTRVALEVRYLSGEPLTH
ncbi:SnoaL-like protein [Actinocorallia herbida]|uniref:SnoaL-like protein n=1 Tax=Actinocorallia herbida TaxID=58109 RepID=A0A3N1D3F4_9ACTN|nr:nuclear transport factor 2 family protein [Actinocorallia herbida]ROO88052.1 SnoaL-like protein [Actinocorallia herbida]